MSRFLKKIFVVLLLFVIAGVFFFCLIFGVSTLTGSMHHNGYLVHMAHADELVTAVINVNSLIIAFIILYWVVLAFFVHILKILTQLSLLRNERIKRHGIFYVSRLAIHHWLSLLQLSPAFRTPA